MVDEILKEAKKHIKDPDWIWDLYDFSILWYSKKVSELSGYSITELKKVNLYDVFVWKKEKTHKFLIEHMEPRGTISAPVKVKDGRIFESTNKYSNFEFENGFYRVGKITKFVEKSSKGN